jgi:hypothetical protein
MEASPIRIAHVVATRNIILYKELEFELWIFYFFILIAYESSHYIIKPKIK